MRLIALAVALAAPAAAAAQEAVVFGDDLVNLGPLYDALVVVISGALLGLLGALARYVQVKWGIALGAHYNVILDAAIERGVDYALRKLPQDVRAENDLIELAADYAIDKAPGAMKRFKLSRESVRQMVEARLPSPPSVPRAPG